MHVSRSRTLEFQSLRLAKKSCRPIAETSLEEQLLRLRIGFVEFQRSSLLGRVQSLQLTSDSWTLSPQQVARAKLDSGLGCGICLSAPHQGSFLSLNRLRGPPSGCCRVCGIRVCDSCSGQELLIYFPDGILETSLSAVRCCLIGLPGCPAVEPRRSHHLRICTRCRCAMVEMAEQAADDAADPSAQLVELYQGHRRLSAELTSRWSLVTALSEPLLGRHNSGGLASSDLRRLAKCFGDAAALLYDYQVYLDGVRSCSRLAEHPSARARRCHALMRSALAADYAEWRTRVREIRDRLDEVLPAEAREEMTRLADKDAVLAVYLLVTQLAYECIRWQMRGIAELDPASVRLVRLSERLEAEFRLTSTDWELDRRTAQNQVKELMLQRPMLKHGDSPAAASAGNPSATEIRARIARLLTLFAEKLEDQCSDRGGGDCRQHLRDTLDWMLGEEWA